MLGVELGDSPVERALPEELESLLVEAELLLLLCCMRIQLTPSSMFCERLRDISEKVLMGVGAVLVAAAVEWLVWA